MLDLAGLRSLPNAREQFSAAIPFPHIIVRDAFIPDALRAAMSHWPDDLAKWRSYQRGKRGMMDRSTIPVPLLRVIDSLNSPEFIGWLLELTGIAGLVPDPTLQGGGLHEVLPGGQLGMHLDFNRDPVSKLYRRVNCLLYLNDPWECEWGGTLYLRDDPLRPRAEVAVEPAFNRLVIFETSEHSWHGHPEPLRCPAGVTRKSIASYYYSVFPHSTFTAEHSTVYRHADGTGTGLPKKKRKGK